VRFGRLSDLVREAGYVARRREAARITAKDVASAMLAERRRLGVEERRVHEAIREGLILVQTKGTRVGQVNGLAIYDFGDHRFGKVARITAAVGAGPHGIVNVERLADLSGSAHDKGVLILSGYLRSILGSEHPLSFTASLAFEQSYGGVDGDSATCAEVFAILSALSGVPVRQDLAVTGSMNQLGDVQAVGGVNDKVEGFFDLCASRGLTGTQGVVIPHANAKDLMLRPEVVDACAKGRFAVYAIDRVEQGIELLSGRPAGFLAAGRFRAGGVYAKAFERATRYGGFAVAPAHPHAADRPATRRLAARSRGESTGADADEG
jgi:predicted ATP-dependent protease